MKYAEMHIYTDVDMPLARIPVMYGQMQEVLKPEIYRGLRISSSLESSQCTFLDEASGKGLDIIHQYLGIQKVSGPEKFYAHVDKLKITANLVRDEVLATIAGLKEPDPVSEEETNE